MLRLDGERHAGGTRVVQQCADPVAHHFARAGEILVDDRAAAILRQAADREDEAARAEFAGFVDGAAVVVLRRAPAAAIGRGEHAAAAQARHDESGVAKSARRIGKAGRRDLVAPRRDAANAVARAAGDDLGQRPLRADGGRVE